MPIDGMPDLRTATPSQHPADTRFGGRLSVRGHAVPDCEMHQGPHKFPKRWYGTFEVNCSCNRHPTPGGMMAGLTLAAGKDIGINAENSGTLMTSHSEKRGPSGSVRKCSVVRPRSWCWFCHQRPRRHCFGDRRCHRFESSRRQLGQRIRLLTGVDYLHAHVSYDREESCSTRGPACLAAGTVIWTNKRTPSLAS